LQCSLHVAAPSIARLLGHRPGVSAGPPRLVRPGFRLSSHLPPDAGQHYRGKLGDSAGRTLTDWVYEFTGCTLILQALVNPDDSRWGYLHRFLDRGSEFFHRPHLIISPLPGFEWVQVQTPAVE